MAKKKRAKPHRNCAVLYNWNEHGYVVQLLRGGEVQHEYKGGNNYHDSHVHIDPHGADKTHLVPVREIQKFAKEEALEVARQHRVPRCRVSVDADIVVWEEPEPASAYFKEQAHGAQANGRGFDDGWAVCRNQEETELLAVVDTEGIADALIFALQHPPAAVQALAQQVIQDFVKNEFKGDWGKGFAQALVKRLQERGCLPKEAT